MYIKQQKEKKRARKLEVVARIAEGAGSNICSQPYPTSRDWKVQRQRERNKRVIDIIKEKTKIQENHTNKINEKETSLVLHPRDQRITHSERTR